MTNEEAIHELDSLLIVADDDFLMKSEAIRMAISALKKRIPKKPIDFDICGGFSKCPVCGALIHGDDYCWKCGQRLDWSERVAHFYDAETGGNTDD